MTTEHNLNEDEFIALLNSRPGSTIREFREMFRTYLPRLADNLRPEDRMPSQERFHVLNLTTRLETACRSDVHLTLAHMAPSSPTKAKIGPTRLTSAGEVFVRTALREGTHLVEATSPKVVDLSTRILVEDLVRLAQENQERDAMPKFRSIDDAQTFLRDKCGYLECLGRLHTEAIKGSGSNDFRISLSNVITAIDSVIIIHSAKKSGTVQKEYQFSSCGEALIRDPLCQRITQSRSWNQNLGMQLIAKHNK